VLRAKLASQRAVPGGIHHSVVVVRDLEASLRFSATESAWTCCRTGTLRMTGRSVRRAQPPRARVLPRRRGSSR
jgi:hypothetical protein